jgi:hypothetical protein
MKKIIVVSLVVGLVCSPTAFGGQRPAGFRGIGPRVGLTVNPDQVHFGGHIDFGDLAENLMMLPNIEIGFGDNVTTVAPSFELDYRFRSDWGAWTPYLGELVQYFTPGTTAAVRPTSAPTCNLALARDRLAARQDISS